MRSQTVEAREPVPAAEAEPEIVAAPAPARGRAEPVQEALDGFDSPFEDEYDEPAFLRRKKRDEADREQPAFLRRSAD